jgi:hypothetical protein
MEYDDLCKRVEFHRDMMDLMAEKNNGRAYAHHRKEFNKFNKELKKRS